MILAVKTADFTTTLVLADEQGGTLHERKWESGRELSAQLLAEIQKLLARTRVGLSDLTGIVVFSGPGSFTSLRIGHSVANALADSLEIPVVGSSGDDWLPSACRTLASVPRPPSSGIALPLYGAEVHITKPRS